MPTEEELRQVSENIEKSETSKKKIETENTESSNKIVFEDDDEEAGTGAETDFGGKTKFRVVRPEQDLGSKLETRVAESVLKFRETMLYGIGSKNRRESSADLVRRKLKRKVIAKTGKC
jgi:hypothetical protein